MYNQYTQFLQALNRVLEQNKIMNLKKMQFITFQHLRNALSIDRNIFMKLVALIIPISVCYYLELCNAIFI